MSVYCKKNIPPCKDCSDRTVGCHSKCKKYIEWKEKVHQIKMAYRSVLQAKKDADDYQNKVMMKNRRR